MEKLGSWFSLKDCRLLNRDVHVVGSQRLGQEASQVSSQRSKARKGEVKAAKLS